MNIRVDLNTPINDGTEVAFRSPVDCSQVTGLKVYYPGNSKEFAFADAHGNNVGDIDHLFAENVVVKVILDVTHGMAFVQNADTNAYLEGRFDDIIDKLCPTFEKTGTLVQCEPVEGYPLTIDTNSGADGTAVVTICGKNLYDAEKYPLVNNTIIRYQSGTHGTSSVFAGTVEYVPVAHLRGKRISIRNAPFVTEGSTGGGIAFYTADKAVISGTNRAVATVPADAVYMRFCINMNYVNEAQIELGETVTDYEAYFGERVEDPVFPCEIKSVSGVNTVYCLDDRGADIPAIEITVTGRADPKAEIRRLTNDVEELKNAILTMGANV